MRLTCRGVGSAKPGLRGYSADLPRLHRLFPQCPCRGCRVADPYKAKLSAIPCRSHCKNRGRMISALHGLIYVSRRILRVNNVSPYGIPLATALQVSIFILLPLNKLEPTATICAVGYRFMAYNAFGGFSICASASVCRLHTLAVIDLSAADDSGHGRNAVP